MTRIQDITCPSCGGSLEVVKGDKPIIHCNNCGKDWETGLVPLGGEMQIPKDFNMCDVIERCKASAEKLGYSKEEVKFKGFRLYFDADGTIISNGFFMADLDLDGTADE
jgi:uncharacterized Zn finger protein